MPGSNKDPPNGLQRAWGNCSFPCVDLTRAGAGVGGVFVATSLKVAVLAARLRRCEPPPSPTVLFKGECVFGRLAQLCCRRAAPSRLTPSPPTACVLSGGLRDPGRSWGAAPPVFPRSARAGTAAVRTALPCPVASSCAHTTVTRWKQRPQHAAADRRWLGLDARPSARWCRREQSFGALRPDVSGCRAHQCRGHFQPSTRLGCSQAAPCGQVISCLQCATQSVPRGRRPVSTRHISPVHQGDHPHENQPSRSPCLSLSPPLGASRPRCSTCSPRRGLHRRYRRRCSRHPARAAGSADRCRAGPTPRKSPLSGSAS